MAINPDGHENLRSLCSVQCHLANGDSSQNFSSILSGEGLDELERGESSLVLGKYPWVARHALVRLKPPSLALQRVVAAQAEIQEEHLVFVSSDGKLAAL